MKSSSILSVWIVAALAISAFAADGNRYAYLDGPFDPYYVSLESPRLTTPQWVGQDGVDAVVILAIDDMRESSKYESFLRPILDRLKQIDGHAPLSIMTNRIDPQHKQLQRWIKEGVSIEIHTIDHPCPLLSDGDWQKAKQTYDRCVDLMAQIPGNQPVAFRMPCCDSMNSPSPRFFETIFADATDAGNFLTIDTSVFNITTSADGSLPRQLTRDADGSERFQKYLPFPSFVNTIRDYPFPYLIGNVCWEFPCVVPSDWEGQNLQHPNNPRTVEDLKAAIDVVVRKQGVMNLVFHPHGWIRNDQIVQLIDHAVTQYGRRVRFMSFREAQQCLDENLLVGTPVRDATGRDNGVRLLDVNLDGYMDVVRLDSRGVLHTRYWQPSRGVWQTAAQPIDAQRISFGVTRPSGPASIVADGPNGIQLYERQGEVWRPTKDDLSTIRAAVHALGGSESIAVMRLRDLNNDGGCELLLEAGEPLHRVFTRDDKSWRQVPCGMPRDVRLLRSDGRDAGVRWVDLDQDGQAECLFSDPTRFAAFRLTSLDEGWQTIVDQNRSDATARTVIPPFIRPDGTNNGAWVHTDHLWWQNEDTAQLPDKVDRVALASILVPDLVEQVDERDPVVRHDAAAFPPATPPEQALATFSSSVGARIELVAAEPLIADPVAFDWGPDGRLWVAEMRDYPTSDDTVRGRVKVLLDEDQDGRYDRAEIFLDGLHYPTGVKAWQDGVLVSGAPHLIFAQDTDGDLRADQRTVLYEGFEEGNQQHLVNGLRWGVDNWLYLANGDSGGEVKSTATGMQISINGRDLRIQPDRGTLEALSGQTQSGRCRDDFGNWFGGSNSFPMWHYLLDDRYLRRNKYFAPPTVRRQVSDFPGPSPVFPTSKTLPRFNDFDRANRFTSACSPLVFHNQANGPAFGPAGTVDTFVCEPVHNLVHRERMSVAGVSFQSHRLRVDESSEFLASTDNWFRPVMARIGPDGAVWIADMYRLVIEHPTWIPQDWQDQLDLRAGYDRGRIYRVLPAGEDRTTRPARLDQLTTVELVARLEHPNRWHRDTAHQMILWRGDDRAGPPLAHLIRNSESPAARIHALYALDGLASVDEDLLATVIRKGRPQVAKHALRVAEPRLASSSALLESALQRVGQDDLALQQQLAYSLGYSDDHRAAKALVDLALRQPANSIIQAAVLSSLTPRNIGSVLEGVLQSRVQQPDLARQLVVQAISLGDADVYQRAITAMTDQPLADHNAWQAEALADLIDEYLRKHESIDTLADGIQDALISYIDTARSVVANAELDVTTRLSAARLMRNDLGDIVANREVLASMLEPQHAPELQAETGAISLRFFPAQTLDELLPRWLSFSPRVRGRLLDEVFGSQSLTLEFLQAAETHEIELRMDARRRQQLLSSSHEQLRALAQRRFAESSASRADVITKYAAASKHNDGDPLSGQVVFKRACAACHRLGHEGHAVGPDLEALSNKSSEFLLGAILDPNRAIESNYLDYYIETVDGRQFTGILRGETGSGVTLMGPDAKQQVVLRNDIELLQATGKSLMPDGLEKDITPSQMVDLMAYLRTHQAPRKQFDGNQPQLAPVRDDGSIRLLAMHAEIYGPSLVYESKHQNLGYWSSENDHAVWTVESKHGGEYTVSLHYACESSTAGNRYVLTCRDQVIGGQVVGTGTWDDYSSRRAGKFRLPAGRSKIIMRSAGPVHSFLADLHQVTLYPVR